MRGRVFVHAVAGGALALGTAGALAGCAPSDTTSAGGASTSSTTTGAATSAGGQPTGTRSSAAPAGGGATGGSSQTQGSSGGGSGACQGGDVGVKLTAPDAGMGHRSYVLVFTDNGSSACTLTGYPGVAVTGGSGAVLVNAQRSLAGYEGGASAVTTVSLPPGGSASAVVEWLAAPTNGQQPSAANCPGMAGGHLEVTPPNTTSTTDFAAPVDVCADLQIHPVVAGTSGRSAD